MLPSLVASRRVSAIKAGNKGFAPGFSGLQPSLVDLGPYPGLAQHGNQHDGFLSSNIIDPATERALKGAPKQVVCGDHDDGLAGEVPMVLTC